MRRSAQDIMAPHLVNSGLIIIQDKTRGSLHPSDRPLFHSMVQGWDAHHQGITTILQTSFTNFRHKHQGHLQHSTTRQSMVTSRTRLTTSFHSIIETKSSGHLGPLCRAQNTCSEFPGRGTDKFNLSTTRTGISLHISGQHRSTNGPISGSIPTREGESRVN